MINFNFNRIRLYVNIIVYNGYFWFNEKLIDIYFKILINRKGVINSYKQYIIGFILWNKQCNLKLVLYFK